MKRALVSLAQKIGLAVVHDSADSLHREFLNLHG